MRCQQVEELLDEYLAGCLPPPLARQLEAHLQHCAACSALLLPQDEQLDALLADDWFALPPTADLAEQVMRRAATSRISWRQLWWVGLAWSGYVAVWLLIALGLWQPGLLSGLFAWHRQVAHLLAPLWTAALAVWRTLGLVRLSPLACMLLLLFAGLAIYGLKRLEKEGLA